MLDAGAQTEQIIATIRESYEVVRHGSTVEVLVEDVRFPDEAVVRLALMLDDAHPDWQRLVSWPRTKR
ncbi:MAG: hypothetical protein KDB54_01395 [Solirubrobacterales bacterium]|nr:hypothetical protein [Solirubrobacterales bacterium]